MIDKVVIYDAQDLESTDFACYYSTHLEIVPLKIGYAGSTLTLTF